MHSLSFWKLLQAAVYLFDDGVQVGWMSVELFYDFGRNIFHLRESDPPVPFIETAARGRFRVLGIEWKQDQFIRSLCLHGLDGFLRHGVPVSHGYENLCFKSLIQLAFQGAGLCGGIFENRRFAPDLCIVTLDFPGSVGGNQFRQGLSGNFGKREVDDIGIAKQVIEERFNGLHRIRTSQLEKHHTDGLIIFHDYARQPQRLSILPLPTRQLQFLRSFEKNSKPGRARLLPSLMGARAGATPFFSQRCV